MADQGLTPEDALAHLMKVLKKKSYQMAFDECGVEEIYEFITTKPEEFQVGAKATQLKVAEVSKIRAVQQWYFAQEEKNL